MKLLPQPAVSQANFLPSILPETFLLLRPRGAVLDWSNATEVMVKTQVDVQDRDVRAIEGWGRVKLYNGGSKGPKKDLVAKSGSESDRYACGSYPSYRDEHTRYHGRGHGRARG